MAHRYPTYNSTLHAADQLEAQAAELLEIAAQFRRHAEIDDKHRRLRGFVEPDFTSVPCKRCGAGIGEECTTSGGNPSGAHVSRWRPLYDQAERDWLVTH